jgi:hypothetical protein
MENTTEKNIPAEDFLRENQTLVTLEIEELGKKLHHESTQETVEEIFRWIRSRMKITSFNEDIFRKRTASEILASGEITGCTDAALLCMSLLSVNDIPSTYIETFDKKWLESKETAISGHVYVRTSLGGESVIIDPMKGIKDSRWLDVSPEEDGRIIYKEGKDSWDVGIENFDDMVKQSNAFRTEWQEKKSI